MYLSTFIFLLLLGGNTQFQDATWNIKYGSPGEKVKTVKTKLDEGYDPLEPGSKGDEWSGTADEESPPSSSADHSLQVFTDGSVECPSADGTFYISGFCSFYIVCSTGYPEFFKCTNGMHFNPDNQKCDLPIRAGCELQCRQPNEMTGIPGKCNKYLECVNDIAEEKSCPENLHFSQLRRLCVAPQKANCEFKCPEKYGFYPLLGYCEEYIKCQDGEAKYQRCPSGLHFNNIIKMCDLPERATCIENCPLPNGIFPVEGDNSAFITCNNDVPRLTFCPEGENFNFLTSQCDLSDDYFHKCPSPNGRFPLPGNRTELFIECIDDNIYIKTCPSELHLNPDTENCEH